MSFAVFTPASRPSILGGIAQAFQAIVERRRLRAAWRLERALSIVRFSAAELEREAPGSIASLNTDALLVQSVKKCPLAQVYGHYSAAPTILRANATGTGFRVPFGLSCKEMNTAWLTVIAEYRSRAV